MIGRRNGRAGFAVLMSEAADEFELCPFCGCPIRERVLRTAVRESPATRSDSRSELANAAASAIARAAGVSDARANLDIDGSAGTLRWVDRRVRGLGIDRVVDADATCASGVEVAARLRLAGKKVRALEIWRLDGRSAHLGGLVDARWRYVGTRVARSSL